jgi:hypothetical protein
MDEAKLMKCVFIQILIVFTIDRRRYVSLFFSQKQVFSLIFVVQS